MAAKIIPFRTRLANSDRVQTAPEGPPLLLILPVVRIEARESPRQSRRGWRSFFSHTPDGDDPAA
jgi:hypothetical protein